MNTQRKLILICLLFIVQVMPVSAQNLAVKTNALYLATASLNAAMETRLSDKWTFDMSVGYNPFTFADNKKIRHIALQPEARYWLCSSFAGHFVGAHLLYSHFNAGGIHLPFGIFPELKDYRMQGDLGAVGVLYGYSWMLPSRRWSMEAVIGVGYGYVKYDKYECQTCGSKVGSDKRGVLMPTKLALSLVYNIK